MDKTPEKYHSSCGDLKAMVPQLSGGEAAPGCTKAHYKFNSTQRPSSKRPMPKTPLFALATRQVQQIPTRPQRQHTGLGVNTQLGAGVDDVQVAHGQLADAV